MHGKRKQSYGARRMSYNSKWIRLHKQGKGAFNCEVYVKQDGSRLHYWIKLYIYNKVAELSGDYETLTKKMEEFAELWNELQDVIDAMERDLKP